MNARAAFPPPPTGLRIDPDALPIRDRATLRLLARADAATASQLARLIYGRERTAQDRLLALTRAGALERAPIRAPDEAPPPTRTGSAQRHAGASASATPGRAACICATRSTWSRPSARSRFHGPRVRDIRSRPG